MLVFSRLLALADPSPWNTLLSVIQCLAPWYSNSLSLTPESKVGTKTLFLTVSLHSILTKFWITFHSWVKKPMALRRSWRHDLSGQTAWQGALLRTRHLLNSMACSQHDQPWPLLPRFQTESVFSTKIGLRVKGNIGSLLRVLAYRSENIRTFHISDKTGFKCSSNVTK